MAPRKKLVPSQKIAPAPAKNALENYVNAVFPIVGVGTSAGGLEAMTELLQNVPADAGLAFVLVQHHDPKSTSALPQILGRATSMPVRMAEHGSEIQPNSV